MSMLKCIFTCEPLKYNYMSLTWPNVTINVSFLSADSLTHFKVSKFTLPINLFFSLGKVPIRMAFDLIDYLRNETHTAPITEALFQTGLIYNLLEKLGHMDLASRLVVSLPFVSFFCNLPLILLLEFLFRSLHAF